MLPELTQGRNADVVILTPGVLTGELIAAGLRRGVQGRPHRRDGHRPLARWTSAQPLQLRHVQPGLAGHGVRLGQPPGPGPNLLNLFEAGQLKIDEIITQEYTLDQVQQGYDDQAAGTIIRGVVEFDA